MTRDAGNSSDSKNSSLPELAKKPAGRHGTPSEVAQQNQRERLLAGAVKAVEERGFARVSVADIIRHAGVYRQLFYDNFANKEECIEAAFDAPLESLIEQEVRRRLGATATVPSRTSGSSDSPEPSKLPSGHHGIPSEVVQQNQGERLLAGAVKAVEERGIAKVRVVDIIRRAGVSRRTFYEHFANKEECIEVAFGAPADDVDGPSDEVSSLNEVGDASELVQGLRGRQRERLIAATAKAVEERGLAKVRVADIVRHAGVAQTIFYKHFANKEECIEAAFGASFASLVETAGRRRFGVPVNSSHASEDSPAPFSPDLVQPPPGRPGIPHDPIRREERERLIAGAAKAVEERGFAKVRIIDILRHAAVSQKTFYEHFADKWECLEAARDISLIPQSDDEAS